MKTYSFALSLMALIFTGCSDSSTSAKEDSIEGHLSSELVHNPNSLENSSNSKKVGRLVFTDSVHHFGKMKAGEKVSYEFTYKNEGKKDIIIFSARASCGCTIPEYNHDTPIKPNEEGMMKVTFNSEGKHGHERKSILVTTNGIPSVYELFIEADVE